MARWISQQREGLDPWPLKLCSQDLTWLFFFTHTRNNVPKKNAEISMSLINIQNSFFSYKVVHVYYSMKIVQNIY